MRIIKNMKFYKVLVMLLLILNSISISAQTYEPLLTDVWGGVNCRDNAGKLVNTTNYYTPNHCSAGCVAISLSQILNYYEWPKTGTGSNVYSDKYSGALKRHAAFFDGVEYDYANMLNEYMGKPSTVVEQKAVGELAYHAATAVQMNFEPKGSTSNVNKIPFVIENFFRFSGHYESKTYSNFWIRMRENIISGNPVQLAIEASRTGDGHALVVDGYRKTDGKYHLNWGWFNNKSINGWYDIENWTDASSGYNRIVGAMFDMYPVPQISSVKSTNGISDITVSWITSEFVTNSEYTLEQKADGGIWEEVASGITDKSYTINNATASVYQFRVKAKTNGYYYNNSWSAPEVFALKGGYNGYVSTGGKQVGFARQTPNNDLNFTGEYTFETWLNVDEISSNGDIILEQYGVFAMEVNNVTSALYTINFIANSGAKLSATNLKIGKWIHVAVSRNSNETKMFINGHIIDSNTGSAFALLSSNNNLYIANKYRNSTNISKIEADFDQLRISSIARYTDDFTPSNTEHFVVDKNTITYLTFQNVHGIRFKDSAHKLSFMLLNNANSMYWEYEQTAKKLEDVVYELNIDVIKIKPSLLVYPNPVKVNSFIELHITDKNGVDISELKFQFFDVSGKQVNLESMNVNSVNEFKIKPSNVSSGIYYLKINGSDFTITKKIIIK